MDKYIGRLLDNRYEILEIIGSGGMAVVYKARCHRLNRLVAIKILKDDYLEDEDFRRRFHAESQAVAMLSHPNIVSVYDVSTSISMEADYIVMELIEGITLKQYMEKKGVLNWKETLHFAMQIAKALEHAHGRGVVHRDIKPHNVMVLKNGSVKVADFGIARLMSKGDTLTKEALGSVHYISPEQAKGGRVDNRSDIYSLGVVMYEMMSGRPPYEGDSPVSVAIQHINGGAILPSTLNPNIPGGMEQIIMKAMAHDLKDRYDTTTQMLADMDEFRKNPAMLFDYNTPPLDEVTRFNKPLVLNTPKTTADRVEERAEMQKKRKQPEKPVSKPANQPKKKSQPSDEKSSGVATIAIIACSLVTILAIFIILILFLSSKFGKGDTVVVPDLLGKHYDILENIENYEDFVFETRYEPSAESDKDIVLKQSPEENEEVVKNTTITLTLGSGVPETADSVRMIDVVGMTQEEATKQLANVGIIVVVDPKEEHSSQKEGTVTRTEPEKDTFLIPGQTVTLWISIGEEEITEPPVEQKKMPGLEGLTLDLAIKTLQAYGFPEPLFEKIHDEKPAGTVLAQSIRKDAIVPVDTIVELTVSLGPETTEPPTQPPTDPQPVVKDVNIDISSLIEEADFIEGDMVLVEIKRDNVTVYNNTVSVDTATVTVVNQSGLGEVEYAIYVNGALVGSEKVNF